MQFKRLTKKSRRLVFGSLASLGLAVTFNSCQKFKSIPVVNHSSSSSLCSGPTSHKTTQGLIKPAANLPSVFAKDKLILPGHAQLGVNQKITQAPPAPTQLTALIDNECLEALRAGDPQSQLFSLRATKGKAVNSQIQQQAYRFTISDGADLNQLRQDINQDPCVIGVSSNLVYRPSGFDVSAYNDPKAAEQNQLAGTRVNEVIKSFFIPMSEIPTANQTLANQDVLVAVLDTGVDYRHEDLKDSIWKYNDGAGHLYWGVDASTIGSGVVSYDPMDESSIGHGTHVSGLIAAKSNNGVGGSGIAFAGTKIMAVKVFHKDANGNDVTDTSILVNAFQWAIEHGAKVINLSLGSLVDGTKYAMEDPVYDEIMTEAISAGVTVVTATGNATPDFPAQELNDTTFTVLPARYGAKYNGAINVGSVDVDANGKIVGKSFFSHYSTKYVEVGAPGNSTVQLGLLSTLPADDAHPNGTYGYLAGTSQAAPMVSAAAALIIRRYRETTGQDPTPATVESLIEQGATKEPFLTSYFKDGNALDIVGIQNIMQQQYSVPNPTDDGCNQ